MKKNILFLLLLLGSLPRSTFSQSTTVTITTGTGFYDATVYKDLRPGYSHLMNANYENSTTLSAMAWTHSSSNTFKRTFLYFDLAQIPVGATVNSAKLYFYSDPTITSPSAGNGNSSLSGANSIYFEKIDSIWHPSTVTWNNQPKTSIAGRIFVGASSSPIENIQITLTSTVQAWVNNPLSNLGLCMALENELKYRARHYGSTNHPNTAIHPKLVITYTANPNTEISSCGTPDITEEEALALPWYGNETFLENYYDSISEVMDGGLPLARATNNHIQNSWLRIPVKLWIYRIDANTPGGEPNPIPDELGFQRWLDFLNETFEKNGVRFSFYLQDITFVDDEDALGVDGIREKNRITDAHRDNNAVNVHVVNTIDDNFGGESNPLYNAIFITRNTVGEIGSQTFAHEMGHNFFLMHTHQTNGWLCLREPVDRGYMWSYCPNNPNLSKRCWYTGDFLCDTDADPNMADYDETWYNTANCTWDAHGEKDYRGDVYHPDPKNLMAYGNRGCRDNITPQQRAVITLGVYAKKSSNWNTSDNNRFDEFEPDNNAVAARTILVGETQAHTFHNAGRIDNIDVLSFIYPDNGSLRNYRVEVINLDANAVGVVEVWTLTGDENTRALGALVGNVTSTVSGSTTTYTIPCNALIDGNDYAIVVNRGTGTGTRDYSIRLYEDFVNNVAPTITGPDKICGASTTFTLNNLPAGVTVLWTKSANLTQVSGTATGTTYSVKANTGVTYGNATVTATLTSACGTLALQLSPTIGFPAYYNESLSGPSSLPVGQSAIFSVSALVGVNNYNWGFPSGWSNLASGVSGGMAWARLRAGNTLGIQEISVTAIVTCGNNRTAYGYVNVTDGGCISGGANLESISPNPTDSELEISLLVDDDCPSGLASTEESYTYKVYNDMQMEKISGEIKGSKHKIDTRSLPNGIYVIHIQTKKNIIRERFVIAR